MWLGALGDREDLRQFSADRADLIYASFNNNSLTVLEYDIFEFNRNIRYIDFSGNQIKYIDSTLIDIDKIEHIESVNFLNSGCINQEFILKKSRNLVENEKFNYTKCNDKLAYVHNLMTMRERENFFKK